MRRSELMVYPEEAIESLLTLFVYTEQHWCKWNALEDRIAEVDYDKFTEEYKEWFIEFLANVVMRLWRSSKEDTDFNRVKFDDPAFLISNYDWNAFRFGKQKGLDQDLTTRSILCIDKDNLTEQEIKWLRSKCKCQE